MKREEMLLTENYHFALSSLAAHGHVQFYFSFIYLYRTELTGNFQNSFPQSDPKPHHGLWSVLC